MYSRFSYLDEKNRDECHLVETKASDHFLLICDIADLVSELLHLRLMLLPRSGTSLLLSKDNLGCPGASNNRTRTSPTPTSTTYFLLPSRCP